LYFTYSFLHIFGSGKEKTNFVDSIVHKLFYLSIGTTLKNTIHIDRRSHTR